MRSATKWSGAKPRVLNQYTPLMPPASANFWKAETTRLLGNAELWQMSKKVTDFLWISFIILSAD
jgi:hypothetical protein